MSSIAVQRVYLAAMVAVLLVTAFLSFTQPIKSEAPPEQAELFAQVPVAIDPDGKPPVAAPAKGPGSALAYMEVPRFGKAWLWTIVEGIDMDDLAEGPGHYPDTPLMGADGNFAVAGHRAGHGDPFIDFDRLQIGDHVTFKQSGAWWTYSITQAPRIIEPGEDWVLNATSYRGLTLTTCWPKYGNEKRMYVRANLVDWSGPHAPQDPAASAASPVATP
jgi:sortase A